MRRATLLILIALIGAQCAAESDLGDAAAVPAPAFAAASTSAHPDDDSVRCRMSGICEGWPTREACAKDAAAASPVLKSLDPAAARDATLACTFDAAARAEAVRDAARWTWKGYRDCALGWDELRPVSCTGQHWHNLTLTPVDALDTFFLMGLRDEFGEALAAVRNTLRPGESGDANVFETTIRILGGLLSSQQLIAATAAYTNAEVDVEASRALLEAAADLGARLARGFASPSGFPYSDVHLATGEASSATGRTSTSEGTTLSLEFTLLARLTGEPSFEAAALRAHAALAPEVDRHGGLLPQWVSPSDGSTSGDYFMLGARSDSYYEYLLKQWIMTGRNDTEMLNRYVRAMQAVREKLLRRTRESEVGGDDSDGAENDSPDRQRGLLYVGEIEGGRSMSKMDHLVCFLPGVLALGDFFGISTARPGTADAPDLEVAEELAETCYQLYRRTPAGLAPEIVFFSEAEAGGGDGGYPGAHAADVGAGDFYIKEADAHNLLRPETAESLFVLWRVTGNPRYRDQAWAIFRAFERWTRVEGAQQCLAAEPGKAVGAAAWEAAGAAAAEAAAAMVAGADPREAEARGVEAGRAALREMRLHHGFEDQSSPEALLEDAAMGAARATAAAVARAVHATGASLTTTAAEDLARQIRDSMAAPEPQKPQQETEAAAVDAPPAPAPAPPSLPTAPACPPPASMRGGGYSNLDSVTEVPPPRRDKMESFWAAETLKYLYLIFVEPPERCLHASCEGIDLPTPALPLSAWVFNTEAHPLPVVGPADASRIAAVEGLDPALLQPYGESVAEAVNGTARAAQEAAEQEEEEKEGEEGSGGDEAASLTAEEEQEMWDEINEAMAGAAAEEEEAEEMWRAMQEAAAAQETVTVAEDAEAAEGHSEL